MSGTKAGGLKAAATNRAKYGKEFYASSEFFPELKWTKAGDKVKVEYGDSPSLSVPLDYFDNVDFSY